jgi:hypothetical protein
MDAPDVVSGGKGQVVLRLFSVLENGQNQTIKFYSVTDVLNRNGYLGAEQFLDDNLMSYFIHHCIVSFHGFVDCALWIRTKFTKFIKF